MSNYANDPASRTKWVSADHCPGYRNEVQYTSANYEPGSGFGEVDIRGYDNYPLSESTLSHPMYRQF